MPTSAFLALPASPPWGGSILFCRKITDKPLYSRFLADLQYWLVLIGVTGFAIVLTIVGLIQGNAWLNGETIYRVLPEIHLYYMMRASLGLIHHRRRLHRIVQYHSNAVFQSRSDNRMKMTPTVMIGRRPGYS